MRFCRSACRFLLLPAPGCGAFRYRCNSGCLGAVLQTRRVIMPRLEPAVSAVSFSTWNNVSAVLRLPFCHHACCLPGFSLGTPACLPGYRFCHCYTAAGSAVLRSAVLGGCGVLPAGSACTRLPGSAACLTCLPAGLLGFEQILPFGYRARVLLPFSPAACCRTAFLLPGCWFCCHCAATCFAPAFYTALDYLLPAPAGLYYLPAAVLDGSACLPAFCYRNAL